MQINELKIVVVLLVYSLSMLGQDSDPVNFVDPFIGTGGHGHTFPGPTAPFGMVQLGPDTRLTGWDGCSGYHFTDTIVYGFSHTHLSGTGVSDYGDFLFMPITGDEVLNNGLDGSLGYNSSFKKSKEIARAGYYSTYLEKYEIKVELTTGLRTGMHRYSYPRDKVKKLIIDLEHRDELLDFSLDQKDDFHISGVRRSHAWATDQLLHFHARFNLPIVEVKYNEERTKCIVVFSKGESDLLVHVGISSVDNLGAELNLDSEFNDFDFNQLELACKEMWNKELRKMEVVDASVYKKTVFYTALYHTMIAPNLFSDVDGRYRGTDGVNHESEGNEQYTVFSLWDTYRAAHPLYTIIDRKRTSDYIKTFLNQYQQGGQLPMWELAANYTGCMIGYHAVPVIADAYIKGIDDFDVDLAIEAVISGSNARKLGIPEYIEHAFVPGESEPESVSKTLEYAYDDWTIARMAEKMGIESTVEEYDIRAQSYKNVLDPETGFMRARLDNRWFGPFDPSEVNHNYTEANAWQYSFYVTQDIGGWIELLGGRKVLSKKLDDLFVAQSNTTGRHQADITGLIGQYAHGNEPSHHMAYLYNWTGEPYKTQEKLHQIYNEMYSDRADGYSGNEDCGQMSAWLVFSAMGFYPVTPGSGEYVLGSPWLEEVTINLENGKKWVVKAPGLDEEHIYVDSFKLNGEFSDQLYFTHEELMRGGSMEFKMSNQPNISNQQLRHPPTSHIDGLSIVTVPAVINGDKAFYKNTKVELYTLTPNAQIYYQIDNGPEELYDKNILIKSSCELTCWAKKEGYVTSKKATSSFVKMQEHRRINLKTQYGNHYSAGGDGALIDYIKGGKDYRTGHWQGYEGKDLIAEVDLGNRKRIRHLEINFLQDENSWIFMPKKVRFSISKCGKKWQQLPEILAKCTPKDKGTIVESFFVKLDSKVQFVRIEAESLKVCPEYHKGAGGKCWIFADEIVIE